MTGGKVQGDMARGFTLVELLVALVIGMVVLAGMAGMFISGSKQISDAEKRSERLADLHLAATIIEGELRQARAVCWDAAGQRLIYRPLDSTVSIPAACNAVDATHGSFQLRAANATHPTPWLCWDRPNDASGCQEMLRGMNANGFSAFKNADGVWRITLTGEYRARDGQVKMLTEEFKAWPRNQ